MNPPPTPNDRNVGPPISGVQVVIMGVDFLGSIFWDLSLTNVSSEARMDRAPLPVISLGERDIRRDKFALTELIIFLTPPYIK